MDCLRTKPLIVEEKKKEGERTRRIIEQKGNDENYESDEIVIGEPFVSLFAIFLADNHAPPKSSPFR